MSDNTLLARASTPPTPNVTALREYLRAGRDLIPLHRPFEHDGRRERGKSPLHGGWQRRSYDAAAVIERALREHRNVGVRLGDEDLVIDVDPRNFPKDSLPATGRV